ncbi:predicted protein [Histoplasma capsulatum var. duboisii H88]|uniref:Predicted protein n=1 Tax=Ajellomyces capsulatus (strain H88) TaxID=544711 RepID=F0U776_AJEC8|nr:predicted protein [Histoplasma capsulatum var. duboisii H88]
MAFLASEHEKLSAHERACLPMGQSGVLWRTWLQSFSCQKPTDDVLAPHPPWEQFAANVNGAVSGQSPIQPPDSMGEAREVFSWKSACASYGNVTPQSHKYPPAMREH